MDITPTPAVMLGTIGQRLHAAWKASPIKKQKDFFEHAGIARNTGNNWLSDREQPRVSEAIKLCEKYNLTLDYIYRGDVSGLRYEMRDAIDKLR